MARPASRKAVSSLPAIANIDEQLDEVVMHVLMIGGPYDGQMKDAPEIHNEGGYPIPIPFFELMSEIDFESNYIDSNVRFDERIILLLYKREEAWENGRFKYYEYQYQGR